MSSTPLPPDGDGKTGQSLFLAKRHRSPKSHVSFVRFLQSLGGRSAQDRQRIADLLGFGTADRFRNWVPTITPLAYELERLAPALAGDLGPNPEYPWPRLSPGQAPASFAFPVWKRLISTGKGKQLLRVIDNAVVGFPRYA